jgi:hypothetical protein
MPGKRSAYRIVVETGERTFIPTYWTAEVTLANGDAMIATAKGVGETEAEAAAAARPRSRSCRRGR